MGLLCMSNVFLIMIMIPTQDLCQLEKRKTAHTAVRHVFPFTSTSSRWGEGDNAWWKISRHTLKHVHDVSDWCWHYLYLRHFYCCLYFEFDICTYVLFVHTTVINFMNEWSIGQSVRLKEGINEWSGQVEPLEITHSNLLQFVVPHRWT